MAITAKRQRGDVLDSLASPFRVDGAFRHMATQNLSGLDIDQLRGRAAFRRRTCDALPRRQSSCGGELHQRGRVAYDHLLSRSARTRQLRGASAKPALVSRGEGAAVLRQRIADRSWPGIPSVYMRRGARLIVLLCGGDKAPRRTSRKRWSSRRTGRTRRTKLEDAALRPRRVSRRRNRDG